MGQSTTGLSKQPWDSILSVVLAIAIAGFVGALGYFTAKPRVVERFTEFYMLGLQGKASGYPQTLILGDEGKLILGIANREQELTEYKVDIVINGERTGIIGPINLQHDERWEREVSFLPTRLGPRQKVEFLLYKGSEVKPYASLVRWINVRDLVKNPQK